MQNIEKQRLPHCLNCGHPLSEEAQYCENCGQKAIDGRPSFKEWLEEFTGTLFNLDNKVFHTLLTMCVPGKLTKDYFDGKRIRFYHPLRFFILAAAILITVISIKLSDIDLNANSFWEQHKTQQARHEEALKLDSLRVATKEEFPEKKAGQALDSLFFRYTKYQKDILKEDSTNVTGDVHFGPGDDKGADENDWQVRVATKDLLTLSEDSLVNKYQVKGFWERLKFKQGIRLQKAGDQLIYYLIGNILWMALLMMPLVALALKLLYVRRGFYYSEHLLFAFHTHSFAFLLFSLSLLLETNIGWPLVIMAVYLFFALKRFYGQGWWKTLWKFLFLNALYILIVAISLVITTLVSMMVF